MIIAIILVVVFVVVIILTGFKDDSAYKCPMCQQFNETCERNKEEKEQNKS